MPAVRVKHLMSKHVISLFAEQRLPLAADLMELRHLRHLPVIDDERRVVGLVSHRDLLRAQISSQAGLTAEQARARHEEIRVAQIMTRDVWTTGPEALASAAGQTLAEHGFGCLPVIDDAGLLVGIITERDFLRFAIHALAAHDDD